MLKILLIYMGKYFSGAGETCSLNLANPVVNTVRLTPNCNLIQNVVKTGAKKEIVFLRNLLNHCPLRTSR